MVIENTFTGEYLYSIDAKDRVNIPSKFRNALTPKNKNIFYITRGMDQCIVAYPLEEWKKVQDGLRNLSSASKVYRSFIRSITRYAAQVKFDKQGRIQLTQVLKNYAQLEKEVTIIGMVNKIELWNPDILNELEKTSLRIDPEEYKDLADKIIL
ncbi:MAG: division/cell wall cluster transcriptional repressor MraZ [Candidatus Marinimicrobia bacterium]|nr:division/cell wall cluster transcriptional repressor MraZ [Candidatus Neomarinimicrobiota bacterium]MBL7046094.1 division/cell wall cluster transcriptional repressor MraZ [Candidatus Neomarinimicrobiota bacterium]